MNIHNCYVFNLNNIYNTTIILLYYSIDNIIVFFMNINNMKDYMIVSEKEGGLGRRILPFQDSLKCKIY